LGFYIVTLILLKVSGGDADDLDKFGELQKKAS
jgi:hypothetical protein